MFHCKIPRTSLAHACCVINPWAACNGVSSAPLNRKMTLCRNRFSCCDKTRNTSNITQQLAASSLAPGLQKKRKLTHKMCLRHFSIKTIQFSNKPTCRQPNQNDNLTLMHDFCALYFRLHRYRLIAQQHFVRYDKHWSLDAV